MIGIVTLCLAGAAALLALLALLKKPPLPDTAALERRLAEEMRAGRQESNALLSQAVKSAAETQTEAQKQIGERQDAAIKNLNDQLSANQRNFQTAVSEQLTAFDKRLSASSQQSEMKLENVRKTMEERLTALQQGNEKKLDEMRHTVDEKLQKTLNERLQQSFSLVNERLEQVHKGLGEMQTLATGVGDLKKVLSNVKTRGILGEIQLGAILEEILPPEQYATNVATVPGSNDRVEFAVRLPGDGEGETVWLPIDAKFPADAYANLLEAYDTADSAQVEAAGKVLENRIRAFAKDIHDKYIHPPETTEFGIIFLPVEGLYAEVVRRGLVERLQRDYRVNIAGPTTMAALLNSLQMGFKTLAIQKSSGEIRKVLEGVTEEFNKFGVVLDQTKRHLDLARDDIEKLVGVRTRQIQRRLKDVSTLSSSNAPAAMPPVDLDDPALLEEDAGAEDALQ